MVAALRWKESQSGWWGRVEEDVGLLYPRGIEGGPTMGTMEAMATVSAMGEEDDSACELWTRKPGINIGKR